MPELVQLMSTGGLCVGLLDPVSNIILNTVSLLPPGFQEAVPRKSTSLANKSTFYDIASRSYLALIGFLLDYFGCLTEEQAGRYLRWADADLALAVLLIEYDLYSALTELLPNPGSGRTQASLELAVRRAGHPAPDRLVQLTSSVFPPQRLDAIKSLLAGGTNLTVDDLYLLHRLIQESGATSNVHITLLPQGGLITRVLKQAVDEGAVAKETTYLGDGYKTTTMKPVGDYISSLRSSEDMDHKKELCWTKAYALQRRFKDCGESCEHLQSLRMRILDIVHSLYLDTIALLPDKGANWLIRDILVAGHCYGLLKPVGNIIVNSIWHNRLCTLTVADCSAQYDILDPLSLLRTEVRSLEGTMELVRAIATRFSTRDMMINLLKSRCDTRGVYEQFFFQSRRKDLSKDFDKMEELRSVFNTTSVLSVGDINRIADLVDEVIKITPELQPSLQSQVPQMHKDAYSTMLRKRSEYECQSKYFRSKVGEMLDKYSAQHPWEGKYMLGVICGVEKCGYLFTECYRVNFMAGNTHGRNTLFFAEFWASHKPDESKPDICCPLNPPYTGRCFYSKNSSRKIVYPDSAKYYMCDVTAHGIGNVDDITDADFVYFDSERATEFVKKVNSYYAEKSFWHPTVLDTGAKIFACISFDEYYPCSSAAELGIGLSLGELV
ncbi:hypothetical protein QYE76_020556 [Lolium multiflorum]|uniref:Uncharacterized protein n=1 Tax=Lolium multiflorum TaxID=4521 RepID=A0AAD8R7Z3_LOLMU|nr:hypothetical protein QYE76_020556 [Lolium multiflorum]